MMFYYKRTMNLIKYGDLKKQWNYQLPGQNNSNDISRCWNYSVFYNILFKKIYKAVIMILRTPQIRLPCVVTVITLVSFISPAIQEMSASKLANLPKFMKGVGLYKYLPISNTESLLDLQFELPVIQKTDVLVEVKATSVNPIDTKQRAPKPNVEANPRILGWDGAGVIVAKGEDANIFNIGEEVFFTGDLRRNGSNAQYMAINQLLVGPKPKSLSYEEAAAMPLTSVTAYETIYDRLLLTEADKNKSFLIINSAGGVGSVASQIAKNLGLNVIGTASRPESQAFTLQHGADVVINHTMELEPQLQSQGFADGVDYILVNYDPFPYWDTLMKIIKPQGRICLIVDSSGLVDLRPLKDKSVTLVSESMLTRIKYDTEDLPRHHDILQEVSKQLDNGKLKCTLTKTMSPINAANLREAHRLLEEQKMLGKLVLTGF